jgi:acetyl esterase/lipase
MNEIPFHERFFSTSEPPSQILYSARLAKTVVTSFFKSLISYVLRGTIHPEWTLSYHIANSVLRTIILANRGGPQSKSIPDFNHFQQRTLAMKPGKIKDVIISTESFSPDQSVIEFLKSNIPASCWPADRAQDTAVEIEADWISHKDARTEKVILHFHGGGYVQLSNKTHRKLSALISKLSTCRVFSINYRLAPQNPFPCSVIDAVSAYKHLLKSYNPGNIILMGY